MHACRWLKTRAHNRSLLHVDVRVEQCRASGQCSACGAPFDTDEAQCQAVIALLLLVAEALEGSPVEHRLYLKGDTHPACMDSSIGHDQSMLDGSVGSCSYALPGKCDAM